MTVGSLDSTDRSDFDVGEAASSAASRSTRDQTSGKLSTTADISRSKTAKALKEDQELNPSVVEGNPIHSSDSYIFLKPWSLLLSSGAKTLSAGFCLFDYVSSILVLREDNILGTKAKYSGRALPYSFVGLDVFNVSGAHALGPSVIAAVLFKLKLPPEEHSLK